MICALGGFCGPQAVVAHPHIFVEAGLEIIFDADNRPEALRISWTYDPLFSMLLLSDMGLDDDFDGVLRPDERAELQGFDMNWIDDYHGDTHVSQRGRALELGGPEQSTSDYEDGRLHSSHLRKLIARPDPEHAWEVSVHDPSYYTRYTLSGAPALTGASGCKAKIIPPDLAQAEATLLDELDSLAETGVDAEVDFPAVGALFAETVRVSCRAR
jgi:polyphosphate kinase